jgi:hypothetical protein
MTDDLVEKIAPYPVDEENADAISFAKHSAAYVVNCSNALMRGEVKKEHRIEVIGGIVNMFSIAYLLREMYALSPEAADKASRELWVHLDAGDSTGTTAWEWLEEWGIDPNQLVKE